MPTPISFRSKYHLFQKVFLHPLADLSGLWADTIPKETFIDIYVIDISHCFVFTSGFVCLSTK